MNRIRMTLVALMLLVLGTTGLVANGAGATTANELSARAPLVGTWQLVSFEGRLDGNPAVFPFGRDAQGELIYTKDGRMSVAVWKANRQNFAINDWQKGTPEEYAAAMQSYIEYRGTVEVDRERRIVRHHVLSSALPNWHGSVQQRFYRFIDEDHMELTTPPVPFNGQQLVGALVWERVEE